MSSCVIAGGLSECPVCLDQYKLPQLLTCHHTFCKNCVDRLIRNDYVKCPLCKKISWIKDVVPDFRLNQVLEVLQIQQSASESDALQALSTTLFFCVLFIFILFCILIGVLSFIRFKSWRFKWRVLIMVEAAWIHAALAFSCFLFRSHLVTSWRHIYLVALSKQFPLHVVLSRDFKAPNFSSYKCSVCRQLTWPVILCEFKSPLSTYWVDY